MLMTRYRFDMCFYSQKEPLIIYITPPIPDCNINTVNMFTACFTINVYIWCFILWLEVAHHQESGEIKCVPDMCA